MLEIVAIFNNAVDVVWVVVDLVEAVTVTEAVMG